MALLPELPAEEDELPLGERRGILRRLEHLERDFLRLSSAMQRVEIEQANAREVMKSRFDALYKGQDLLLAKVDQFFGTINRISSDPEESAAGKALLRSIELVQATQEKQHLRIDALSQWRDEMRGAIRTVQALGIIAIVTACVAIFRAFLGGQG